MKKSITISLRLSDEEITKVEELKKILNTYTQSTYSTSEIIRICLNKTYSNYNTERRKKIEEIHN